MPIHMIDENVGHVGTGLRVKKKPTNHFFFLTELLSIKFWILLKNVRKSSCIVWVHKKASTNLNVAGVRIARQNSKIYFRWVKSPRWKFSKNTSKNSPTKSVEQNLLMTAIARQLSHRGCLRTSRYILGKVFAIFALFLSVRISLTRRSFTYYSRSRAPVRNYAHETRQKRVWQIAFYAKL